MMNLGLRVVRGPDWEWKDEDDGEGHVGTIVEIEEPNRFSKNTVTVLWDSGYCDSYRAGFQDAYDLRTVDNAPSGVKQADTWCNSCANYIEGIKWTCKQCQDFDLCSPCYMSDKHDLTHPFFRYDTLDSCGVEVPRRKGASKIQMKGIFASAKVVRGSDWQYGAEDGRKAEIGTVTTITSWDKNSRSAACVKWSSGGQSSYRVGFEGKMDLKYKQDAADGCYYPDHLPVLGDEMRTCEIKDYEDATMKGDENEKGNGFTPKETKDLTYAHGYENQSARKETKSSKSLHPRLVPKGRVVPQSNEEDKTTIKKFKNNKSNRFAPKDTDDKATEKDDKNSKSNRFTPKDTEEDKTAGKGAKYSESDIFTSKNTNDDKATKREAKSSESDIFTRRDADDGKITRQVAEYSESNEFTPKKTEDDETTGKKADNSKSDKFTAKETEDDKAKRKEGKSSKIEVTTEETYDYKSIIMETKTDESLAILSENLKTLLVGDQFCDLTIKVADREFQIHRAILGARSPVFASMLTLDMMEKNTGVVAIDDCNPDTFEDFLFYLYSGTSERITNKNVTDLYQIADKYYVQGLRDECVQFMIKNLSVDFFCDVVTLALRHGDKDLTKFTIEYFLSNTTQILSTVKWQIFMQENPVPANELCIKAFSKTSREN